MHLFSSSHPSSDSVTGTDTSPDEQMARLIEAEDLAFLKRSAQTPLSDCKTALCRDTLSLLHTVELIAESQDEVGIRDLTIQSCREVCKTLRFDSPSSSQKENDSQIDERIKELEKLIQDLAEFAKEYDHRWGFAKRWTSQSDRKGISTLREILDNLIKAHPCPNYLPNKTNLAPFSSSSCFEYIRGSRPTTPAPSEAHSFIKVTNIPGSVNICNIKEVHTTITDTEHGKVVKHSEKEVHRVEIVATHDMYV